MKYILLVFLVSVTTWAQTSTTASSKQPVFSEADTKNQIWSTAVAEAKKKYNLQDAYVKKVDNHGNGDEDLYGTRNFRVVLHGVLYRGGANNTTNKLAKRDNHNPLPKEGLQNLCQQNFSEAIYLYKTNFEKAPNEVSCNVGSEKNKIVYKQITGLHEQQQLEFLRLVYRHITDRDPKPIYAHCWNGWHASGLVSALSLIQFCGVSNEKALEYWIKNTDGNNKHYDKLKDRIKNFKPISDFKISPDIQSQICPQI